GCIAVSNATPARPSAEAGSTIALEVEDLDALIAHLRAHDVPLPGQVIKGPHCRMQPCLDPDGNSLILHQLDRSWSAAWTPPSMRSRTRTVGPSYSGWRPERPP